MTMPPGWANAPFEHLIGPDGVFTDGDWIESKDQDPNGDVRLVQLADIGDGEYRDRSARFLTQQKADDLGCTFLSSGDLLIARMPDPLGRACIFPGDPRPSVTAVDVCVVRAGSSGPNHRWLMYFINSPAFRASVASLQSGSTRKRISRRNLASLALPLPPLGEQHRIVAAIEEHLSRLDAAVAALERVRAALPRYRAAVLKAACEGRLPWDNDRDQHARPNGMREGWKSTTIAAISEVGTGSTPLTTNTEFYAGGDVPWVTSGALNALYVRGPSGFVTEKAVAAHRLRLFPPHTLLVAMYGETRGKSAELLIPATINQAIAAIQLTEENAQYRPFVRLCLLHEHIRLRQAGRGGAQPNLNLSHIRGIRVNLPPVGEQDRIVAEVDRRLSLADAADRAVSAGLAKAKRLRQAILKRAFEGRLVPQDFNDEPASVLLERIRRPTT